MNEDALGFFESMALSVLFNVLKAVVKNPQKKAVMAKALLKLRDAINSAYPESLNEAGATLQFAAPPPLTASHFVNATESAVPEEVDSQVQEVAPAATGHANGW